LIAAAIIRVLTVSALDEIARRIDAATLIPNLGGVLPLDEANSPTRCRQVSRTILAVKSSSISRRRKRRNLRSF
jgi:hypothetical protein